jgi:hypothetical protein
MGTVLIVFGIFLWCGFTIVTFVFLTPTEDIFRERLKRSLKIILSKKTGPVFGVSLMKVTGIFWVFAGVIISILGESFLQGTKGDIVLAMIFLTPVLIGSIITERRKKSQSK